ncbi:MAG: elongation factor Ts [Chloroflexi bacterium]|nr:elongation factor Ts [Chloroflexota bacterium]
MATLTEMIKKLRAATGAGVLDSKKALEATGGDYEKAEAILMEKGLSTAAKKAEREMKDGRIEAYVHPGNKLVAVVEVSCETDFVARTEEFIALCHDVAMQVAAINPRWVSRDDVPEEIINQEMEQARADLAGQNKPEAVIAKALEGKMARFYQENCLLEQPFIKDESQTVGQLVTNLVAKLRENVQIQRFARFKIG